MRNLTKALTAVLLTVCLSGVATAQNRPAVKVDDERDVRDNASETRQGFTYNDLSTAGLAFVPRNESEYAEGDHFAPVQIYLHSDPTSLDTATFLTTHWPQFVSTYVEKGQARIAFRPAVTHPKAAITAVAMHCVGVGSGLRLLTDLAQTDPLWGSRSYADVVAAIRAAAQKLGMDATALDACIANPDESYKVNYWFRRDRSQIRLVDVELLNIYVNGGWWPGIQFTPFVKKHVDVILRNNHDYGENNPHLTIKPNDRVLGNRNAPVVVFDFANIIRINTRPLFANGIDSRLRAAVAAGQMAYVYRPFHFEGRTRSSEIAARCVPPERFFEFLDYVTANSDFWRSLDDPTEMIQAIAKFHGATDTCFKDPAIAAEVDGLRNDALNDLGVIRVSTYFYRGISHLGSMTFENLTTFIQTVNTNRAQQPAGGRR
jgi:protein-disulfide isomerase